MQHFRSEETSNKNGIKKRYFSGMATGKTQKERAESDCSICKVRKARNLIMSTCSAISSFNLSQQLFLPVESQIGYRTRLYNYNLGQKSYAER